MRGVNMAILCGNVGADPDVRQLPSGSKVANVPLATNRAWRDAKGELQESVSWHRLSAFGKVADIIEQYVSKGDMIHVVGRIDYRTGTGKDGQETYWTNIIVNDITLMGGNGDRDGEENGERRNGSNASGSGEVRPPQDEVDDDDLPF